MFNSFPAYYPMLLVCLIEGINVGSVGCCQYHHGIREELKGTDRWMEAEIGEREKGKQRALGFYIEKKNLNVVDEAESAQKAVN